MSHYTLAERAKISREYVCKLESGRSYPTLDMLQRLTKALGVLLTKLLG